jgi:hypothetical protein
MEHFFPSLKQERRNYEDLKSKGPHTKACWIMVFYNAAEATQPIVTKPALI